MHVFRRAGYSFRFTICNIGRAALDWRCHDAHDRAALGCKQHIHKEVRRKHLHNPLSDTVCTSLLFHSPADVWGRGIRMGPGSVSPTSGTRCFGVSMRSRGFYRLPGVVSTVAPLPGEPAGLLHISHPGVRCYSQRAASWGIIAVVTVDRSGTGDCRHLPCEPPNHRRIDEWGVQIFEFSGNPLFVQKTGSRALRQKL